MATTHCSTNRCARDRSSPRVHKPAEDVADVTRCLTGYALAIIPEARLGIVGKKKIERNEAPGKVTYRHHIDRLINLLVEVVDPQFVEIAQHNVPWTVGN